MNMSKRCCLAVVLAWLAWAPVERGHAEANPFQPPTGFFARTNFRYDGFGNLLGVYTVIWLNNGDVWWFALPTRFLDQPLAWQINYIDARFGLGWDRRQVLEVLQSIQTSRFNQQVQQNFDRMNRLNQQRIWQPPPIPQPIR